MLSIILLGSVVVAQGASQQPQQDLSKLLGSLTGAGGGGGGAGGLLSSLGGGGSGGLLGKLGGSSGLFGNLTGSNFVDQLKGLVDVQGILEGFTKDLTESFTLTDAFPLDGILGSDPMGKLPLDAITSGNVNSAAQLFKTKAAQEPEPTSFDPLIARIDSCVAELRNSAKAFQTKYARFGGGIILAYTNQHIYAPKIAQCRRLKATANLKHRQSLQQFNLAANAQSHLLAQAASKGSIPLATAQTEKLSSFLNAVFSKKTQGTVDDFGEFLVDDGRALCQRLTDEELGADECSASAESLCETAEKLAATTEESDLKTAAAVRAEAGKFKRETATAARVRSQTQPAAQSCRCIGATMRASVMPAGHQRLGPRCLSATKAALATPSSASARPPPTIAQVFMEEQKAGAPVSYQELLRPDQLAVTNMAGKILG